MWTRLELLKICLQMQAESGKEKEQINPDIHKLLEEIQLAYGFELKIEEQENGNIYITKGESKLYPCIIAHSDDVAKYNPNKAIIHFEEADWIKACDKVTGEPHDTGGDDKVSIWAIMQALIDLPELKAAIFISEENGCNGSKAANMEFFKDCKFVAQFDRNHKNNDFINFTNGVKVCCPEFEQFIDPYLTKYGYKTAFGTVTDVGQLRKNGLEVSSFNISSGYFKPHTNDSYVIPSKLFTSYDLVLELFKDHKEQSVFPVEVPKVYNQAYESITGRFLKDLSSNLLIHYNKENKHLDKHKINNVLSWVIDLLDKIDDHNQAFPDYTPMTDIVHDYFLELEEEKIHNYTQKQIKSLCNPKTCKENRITDYHTLSGIPEEVCTMCDRVFELPDSQGKLDFQFGSQWDM